MRGAVSRCASSGSSPLRRDRQTVGRTDVDARIALDAQRVGEVRLDVAVETALDFDLGLLRREALLHLDRHLLEALRHLDVPHLHALRRVVVVAVGPLVQPHLRARQRHAVRRPLVDRHALAVVVDRDRRLMPVLDRPDDVGRTERRVAAEEHAGTRRHERRLVDDRHVPLLVELEPDVALDPRERVVLADRQHHRIAGDDDASDRLPAGACRRSRST